MIYQYNRKQQHVFVFQQQLKSIFYNNPPMNPQYVLPHFSNSHHSQEAPQNFLKTIKILKKLINLHSTQKKSQENQSISQMIMQIIQKLLHMFKNLKNNKQKQQDYLIQQQLTKIRQIVQQFVDQIMDIIENVKKDYKKIERQGKNCQINLIYEEFYTMCSQFMNDSYQYSNKLCILLSQYNAKSLSQQKYNTNVQKTDSTNTDKFRSSNTDYYILKKLLQKVSSTRKIYQQQKKNWQNQKYILQQITKEQKQQIKNLINTKNQLFQDLYEIQQAIQARNYGIIKNIVNREKYQNKQQSTKIEKQIRNNQQQKINKFQHVVNSQNQQKNTIKYMQQIKQLSHNNQLLQNQNKQLKIKLDKYKKQIHRAAWIISIQNRQINLNQDKNKLYLKSFFNSNFNNKGQDSVKNNPINSHDFNISRQKKYSIPQRQYQKSPSQHFEHIKLDQNNRPDNNLTMHI